MRMMCASDSFRGSGGAPRVVSALVATEVLGAQICRDGYSVGRG